MKKQIKKSTFTPKKMKGISQANQAFGYLSAIAAIGMIVMIYVLIILAGVTEEAGLIVLALLVPAIGLITTGVFTLIWIILSIVQCFEAEKIGNVGSITPKIVHIVLSIFLSLAFVILLLVLALYLLSELGVIGEATDELTNSIMNIVWAMVPLSLGQAIFNSVYTHNLKKSL